MVIDVEYLKCIPSSHTAMPLPLAPPLSSPSSTPVTTPCSVSCAACMPPLLTCWATWPGRAGASEQAPPPMWPGAGPLHCWMPQSRYVCVLHVHHAHIHTPTVYTLAECTVHTQNRKSLLCECVWCTLLVAWSDFCNISLPRRVSTAVRPITCHSHDTVCYVVRVLQTRDLIPATKALAEERSKWISKWALNRCIWEEGQGS